MYSYIFIYHGRNTRPIGNRLYNEKLFTLFRSSRLYGEVFFFFFINIQYLARSSFPLIRLSVIKTGRVIFCTLQPIYVRTYVYIYVFIIGIESEGRNRETVQDNASGNIIFFAFMSTLSRRRAITFSSRA